MGTAGISYGNDDTRDSIPAQKGIHQRVWDGSYKIFFFYELLDGVYTISSLLLNFLFFIELARENMKTELVIGGYKWRANLKRDLSYSSSAFLRYLVNGYLQ